MSAEINQIHKNLFVNLNDNDNNFEDIEDEPISTSEFNGTNKQIKEEISISNGANEININTDTNIEIGDINPIYASDEGLSLIQASKDYSDAIQSIATNSWDTNSWNVFIEEVEAGRGGATSLEEAYLKYLEKFPLSAKIQKKLIDYYIREKFNTNATNTTSMINSINQSGIDGESGTSFISNNNSTNIDFKFIESLYNKCLSSCRNVPLYFDYLNFMKFHLLDKIYENGQNKKDDMTYSLARSNYENLVEKVLEQIGMAMDSNNIWKLYIEFINNYPELGIADSAGRKLSNMRKVYQRAICIPMHDLDVFWRDYEALEKSVGEHLAERVLPEYKEKYLHAKAIFRERQRITSSLVFDKLAIPPTQPLTFSSPTHTSATSATGSTGSSGVSGSSGNMATVSVTMSNINLNLFHFETQQLAIWVQWLKYELSNPDNLPLEGLKAMLTYLYRKCLCCFRYHPEVWLSFANFYYNIEYAIQQVEIKKNEVGYSNINTDGSLKIPTNDLTDITLESKNILAQAIQILPNIAMIRIAIAEYEEKSYYLYLTTTSITTTATTENILQGKLLNAKNILKELFDELPSSLTFSVYQKFLRKHEGISAARKFFSETYKLRLEKRLDCEVHLSHAVMEYEMNQQPLIALKIMQLGMMEDKSALSNIQFVRLYIKVLLSQGLLKDIRWLCYICLGRDPGNVIIQNLGEIGNRAYVNNPSISSTVLSNSDPTNTIVSHLESYAKNEELILQPTIFNSTYRYYIWCDLYHAEVSLGQSNIIHIDTIRKYKNDAKRVMDEHNQLRVYNTKSKDKSNNLSNQMSTTIYGSNNDLNYFSNFSDTLKTLYDKYPVITLSDSSTDMLLKSRVMIQTYLLLTNNDSSQDGLLNSNSSSIYSDAVSGSNNINSMEQLLMNEMLANFTLSTRRQQLRLTSSSNVNERDRDRNVATGTKNTSNTHTHYQSSNEATTDSHNNTTVTTTAVSYDAYNQVLSYIPDDQTLKYSNTTVLLKDFLSKLPVYNGPPFQVSDIDQFVYHFKNIILPPRPIDIPVDNYETTGVSGSGSGGQNIGIGVGVKRSRLFQDSHNNVDNVNIVNGGGGAVVSDNMDYEDDYYEDVGAIATNMNNNAGHGHGQSGNRKEDVFKQRRRQKRGGGGGYN